VRKGTVSARVARSLDARMAVLPPELRRRLLFLRVHRRWPSLREPRTFSEKLTWRILHDRRPELAWTCDKLQMKEHALASGADVVVPETLWAGTDVRELADVPLPDRWVLKPSHRSGLVHFGAGAADVGELARSTGDWLGHEQLDVYAEWAYGQAVPRLFVEEFVSDGGQPPPDYKFFVFDGQPRLIQVDLDRFAGHRRSLFTPDWQLLEVELGIRGGGPLPQPRLLPRMLEAAAALARDSDFLRIDLYARGEDVVFGEHTPYPGSGLERFRPRSFDETVGGWWTLPDLPRRPGR
jgi:hypothetical protein